MNNDAPADLSDSLFRTTGSRGVLTRVLDLFSSVRLGIVLLTILFVYATIGSAGIVYPAPGPADFTILGVPFRHEMIRQWRAFELTEFEWFHTWFFNALIVLICVNIVVTTLRRIRFSLVNLGVWMIHTGIIILSIGSFIYFGLKVEGDAPVLRRQVVIDVPGLPTGALPAVLGASTEVAAPDGSLYRFQVSSIDPDWELRSEGDIGKSAFAVTVSAQTPKGQFMRQLLAGYPEYTEDVLQGRGRVKKLEEFGGSAIFDDTVSMSLEPIIQDSFWLKDSAALCVREAGEDRWSQRVIRGLPRYNDYVSSIADDLWPVQSDRYGRTLRPDSLNIAVPAPEGEPDALAGADVRITGYLRYAVMQPGYEPSPAPFERPNPVIELVAGADGRSRNVRLVAMDREQSVSRDGLIAFHWATSMDEVERLRAAEPSVLTIAVPEADIERVITFTGAQIDPDAPMQPLGETGWQFRLRRLVERLPLNTGETITLLLLDLRTPEGGTLSRWVFEDVARQRDHHDTKPEDPARVTSPDARLITTLELGRELPEVQIVAGPGEVGLRVVALDHTGARVEHRPTPGGEPVKLSQRRTLAVRRLIPDAVAVTKPLVIPWQQRDQNADSVQAYAMVRVEVSSGGRRESRWIPFHRYSIDDQNQAPPTLTRYEPGLFTLADGRRVEVIVSRERRPLPTPVALDDFILTSHLGGFTGESLSIRDWTSIVRFRDAGGSWTEPMTVSTNNPASHRGFWYFQSFWDAPRPPSQQDDGSLGMAFTGLGVGNREGVFTQLAGCCISVLGMLYAFYVKPIIKRRRRERVLKDIAAGVYARDGRDPASSNALAPARQDEPIFEETSS